MHPALRVLLLFCQVVILGLGILMAVNGLYGMAAIWVLFCWHMRPDAFRHFGAPIARWAQCAFLGHDWRWAGRGLPDSASPGDFSRCARCSKDSREPWEIEDDTLCRMERLHHLVKR